MKKVFLIAFISLITFAQVSAEVKTALPGIIVGGSVTKIAGVNLDSPSNPFTAQAVTLSGASINLPTELNSRGDRAKIQMPTVTIDNKVVIKISGGDIASTEPQSYLVVLLSQPSGFTNSDASIAENVALPDNSGSFTGPQGPRGPIGPGGSGPTGATGPTGPVAVAGGTLDVNSLPTYDMKPDIRMALTAGTDGNVDITGSTFFITSDSNAKTINQIISLSGATVTGHKVTILFKATVDIADTYVATTDPARTKFDSVPTSDGNILLVDEDYRYGREDLSRTKYRFHRFYTGDTLELIYDGQYWYELNRSSTSNITK